MDTLVTRYVSTRNLKETIEHFTHPHPLKLVQLDAVGYFGFQCYCCGSMCSTSRWRSARESSTENVMYACRELECNPQGIELIGRFPRGEYLCVPCSELGESLERNNTLHPEHSPLKLRRSTSSYSSDSKCSACVNRLSSNFSYQCDEEKCNFEMHVTCAHSLNPSLSLPSHSHLLSIIVDYAFHPDVLNCESCHSVIPYPRIFARCVPCNLNFHISCLRVYDSIPRLVMDVQHHPQHPLSLARTDSCWSCDVCSKNKIDWSGIRVYACLDCNNFTAHLSCIFRSFLPCPFSNLVTNVVVSDLVIKDGLLHENMICQRCKKCILNNGVPIYSCQYCHLFLHETCIHQATVVDDKLGEALIFSHPGYDLQHESPLVLVFAHGAMGYRCACCSKTCIGFMFQKKDNKSFVLDLECMLVVPFLELLRHNHPVTLLQRSNTTKSSYFRCIPCSRDFPISESCRLPRTLQHKSHFHPLTLVPCLVENFDIEQCYCDVCEDKREPNECIYYCVECNFEVQLACVKSEVTTLCANKPENIEFITLQEITLEEEAKKEKVKVRDIFRLEEQHSYIHVDKEFDDILQSASKTTWKNSVGENPSYNDEFLSKTLYSDESFKLFITELDSAATLKNTRSTLESLRYENVVSVGEYLVPFNFDEVIETLFDNYGDFGAKCTCSLEAKQYLFVGICKALQSMYNTKVVHIQKSFLMEWWAWLVIGKAAGFEIQFAFEILERAVYAHFGLEADKYADEKLTRIRKKIREVPEEMKELRRKLAEKEKELEETRTKEEKLREEAFRLKKSHLMRKCLTEAEDLVCYSIVELLLPLENDCNSSLMILYMYLVHL